MGKKATKATKKFASSGQLKKTIQARHKHQQIRKRTQSRRGNKDDNARRSSLAREESDQEEEVAKTGKHLKGMSVDALLGGEFMGNSDGDDDDDDVQDMPEYDLSEDEDVGDDDDDDLPEDASFASVDELDAEGETHLLELSKLAEKDPEFYKYLQENDRELLEFDPSTTTPVMSDSEEEAEGDADAMEEDRMPILTKAILKKWQKALLEQRSLRALRKLLVAFRSAAHMNEENQVLAWSIDSSTVYNKLITTTLKYTPVILEHHVPYKTLPNGKFKPPTQTHKLKTLQKLILSYFYNVIHILSQLTDDSVLHVAISESAKIIPYIVSSRKAVKLYLKKCLELWATAKDSIRIAAFLAIRTLAMATDESTMDNVLKGIYLTLVRSSKATSIHTLPSINLMKNSASEIFCTDHTAAYQHAFGYIRQLAIHLRNSMKVKTKDAYKQVHNWQYVHCVDFWAIVLARACDKQAEEERGGKESELKPLIYPLVQVSLGAIKLISNSRSFLFHLHVTRSLQHLARHTETYISLPPYLLPILTSTISPSARPKPSTLRPLNLEVHIRAPQQYLKTRIYADGLVEEATYQLAEWLASRPVQGSIAFPEIVVPIVVALRKSVKNAKAGSGSGSIKDVSLVKGLLERIEESVRWAEQRRKGVTFAPGLMGDVEEWEKDTKSQIENTPLGKYVKVQRKARENRRKLVEKARDGEDEFLED